MSSRKPRTAVLLPATALPSELGAARTARDHVVRVCRDRPASLVDVARLLVSELVTNAVLHGFGDVVVSVHSSEDVLRFEVSDDNPRMVPARQASEPAVTRDGGRGLLLIAALSSAWGVNPRVDGKTVWFQLPLD